VAKTRKRRSAEDAREEILVAAERQLAIGGPSALRLTELADEVGISHPAILHHFGSREGLVSAVVERAVRTLQNELIDALSGGGDDKAALFDRVHETLATRGAARLMAWLLLAGYEPLAGDVIRKKWRAIIDLTHTARVAGVKGTPPAYEDTAFTNLLSALALFGLALVGPATFELAGLGRNPRVNARFRAWLGKLLAEHLAPPRR